MHGSRSKIPSKESREATLRGGIYSGFEVLTFIQVYVTLINI
jgi:hypothetical protein